MSRPSVRRDRDGGKLQPVTMPPEDALFSEEDERWLLASLMLRPFDAASILDGMSFDSDDLYRDAHRELYEVLRDMIQRRERVGSASVVEWLHARDLGPRCGGLAYVSSLADTCPGALLVGTFAGRVQRHAARRRMLRGLLEGIAAVRDGDDPGEVQQGLLQRLGSIATHDSSADHLDTGADLADAIMQSTHKSAARVQLISTGLPVLDELLGGGVAAGRSYVVAGRPKHGKSTLALALAEGFLSAGHRVHIDSLEMTSTEEGEEKVVRPGDVARKLGALVSGIDSRLVGALSADQLGPERYSDLHRASMQIADWPLTIDDRPARTWPAIEAQIRRLKAQHPDLLVVMIDHAGLVAPHGGLDERQTLKAVTGGAKILAKSLGLVLILCAQLNRDASARPFPRVEDVKASGSYEEDADGIFLIMNPRAAKLTQDAPALWLSLAVHRHGPSGVDCWVDLQEHTGRIGDLCPSPLPAEEPQRRRKKPGRGYDTSWAEEGV